MRAPQIIIIVIMALSVTVNAVKHGEQKTDRYHVGFTLIAIAIEAAVLWWGGFWK